MDNINVGIVGNGFVGNAVYQNLRDKVKTKNRFSTSLYLERSG